MSIFVLDASVAVAWYLPEELAAPAREWQQRLLRGEVTLVVPSLHFWEVGNVLRTYVRRGELDEELAREVYALHLDAPLIAAERSTTPWVVKLGDAVRPLWGARS